MRAPAPFHLERLAALPPGFADLAADALADGHRVLEVLREDWDAGAIRFDAVGEALFGAFAGGALLGLCGLTRDPYLKSEAAGRVRRLYVRRAARHRGAGRALLEALTQDAAQAGFRRLRVRAPVASFAFYEACGFLRMVGEPGATHARPVMTPALRGIP